MQLLRPGSVSVCGNVDGALEGRLQRAEVQVGHPLRVSPLQLPSQHRMADSHTVVWLMK